MNSFNLTDKADFLLSKDLFWVLLSAGLVSALLHLSNGNVIPVLVIAGLALGLVGLIVLRNHIPLLFLIGSFFILRNPPGIDVGEVLFYSLAFITLIAVLIPDLVRFQFKLNLLLDKSFLALHFLVSYGIVVGAINGANPERILADTLNYTAILVYFPLRRYLADGHRLKIVAIASIGIIAAVCIRNFMNYRDIILRAAMAWELELARAAVNELLIAFGCLFALALYLHSDTFKKSFVTLGGFGFFLLALIVTQSRGYWLLFVLAAGILFLLVQRQQRMKLVVSVALIFVTALSVMTLFFYDQFQLILFGLSLRLGSLTNVGQDISLMERILEAGVVKDLVLRNPITGYGFGVEYMRQNIIWGNVFESWIYIHNGYLSILYKFGLPGMLIYSFVYGTVLVYAYKIFRGSKKLGERLFALTAFCLILPSLGLNLTSPHMYMLDGLLFISVVGAVLSAIYESINSGKLQQEGGEA